MGKRNVVCRTDGVPLMNNPADICRECELPGKTRQLEEAIKDLIKAVNASNFCDTCSEEFGELACSECPWHQAKIKAIRLLAKEE